MSISILSFLNLPAIICVAVISFIIFGLSKKLSKPFCSLGDLILPMNFFFCSIYSIHALTNLADASQIGPWLAFLAVSNFWSSLLQILLRIISERKN